MQTPTPLRPIDSTQRGTTAIEAVYLALREKILDGTFPPESRLRVEELRRGFGVGSSTVREALSRLLVDKLVTAREQRGFFVAPVSLDDFREISQLRIILETQAVRESVQNGDDAWENRLVVASHQLSKIERQMDTRTQDLAFVKEWEERNSEFHDALVSACGNQWLLRFRATIFAHTFRYRRMALQDTALPRDVRAEHEAIFQAAVDRDGEAAARATEDHIRKSIIALEADVADAQHRDPKAATGTPS